VAGSRKLKLEVATSVAAAAGDDGGVSVRTQGEAALIEAVDDAAHQHPRATDESLFAHTTARTTLTTSTTTTSATPTTSEGGSTGVWKASDSSGNEVSSITDFISLDVREDQEEEGRRICSQLLVAGQLDEDADLDKDEDEDDSALVSQAFLAVLSENATLRRLLAQAQKDEDEDEGNGATNASSLFAVAATQEIQEAGNDATGAAGAAGSSNASSFPVAATQEIQEVVPTYSASPGETPQLHLRRLSSSSLPKSVGLPGLPGLDVYSMADLFAGDPEMKLDFLRNTAESWEHSLSSSSGLTDRDMDLYRVFGGQPPPKRARLDTGSESEGGRSIRDEGGRDVGEGGGGRGGVGGGGSTAGVCETTIRRTRLFRRIRHAGRAFAFILVVFLAAWAASSLHVSFRPRMCSAPVAAISALVVPDADAAGPIANTDVPKKGERGPPHNKSDTQQPGQMPFGPDHNPHNQSANGPNPYGHMPEGLAKEFGSGYKGVSLSEARAPSPIFVELLERNERGFTRYQSAFQESGILLPSSMAVVKNFEDGFPVLMRNDEVDGAYSHWNWMMEMNCRQYAADVLYNTSLNDRTRMRWGRHARCIL